MAVFVCRKCDGHECIVRYLAKHTDEQVRTVRCQKVCSGPVAGVQVAGIWQWFGPLKREKEFAALAALAGGDDSVPKALKDRRSKKRAGAPPR